MVERPQTYAASGEFLYFYLADSIGDAVTGLTSFATGDIQRSLDGAAFADADNLVSITDLGRGWYKLPLSVAENSAKDICWSYIDQSGTKLWVDSGSKLGTGGDPAAKFHR